MKEISFITLEFEEGQDNTLFVVKQLQPAKNVEKPIGWPPRGITSQSAFELAGRTRASGKVFFGLKWTGKGDKQLDAIQEYSTDLNLIPAEIIIQTPLDIMGRRRFKYRVKNSFTKRTILEESLENHPHLLKLSLLTKNPYKSKQTTTASAKNSKRRAVQLPAAIQLHLRPLP